MSRDAAPSMTHPLVTVVVPTRDEEDDIAGCLGAIAAQDLPLVHLEVIVVDGASSDGTIQTAKTVLDGHCFGGAHVVVNDACTTPSNLNVGLRHARGDYICRVDARSRIPPDYVRRCVAVLECRGDVAVVGGAQVALASGGPLGPGISRALNNPVGMGLSKYRSDKQSAATDTVYLGFFRSEDLHRIGGWDEAWETNQDYELNRRMGGTGLIWYDDALAVGYVPRSSLRSLARQYHRFGRWKVRYWRRTGDRPRPRQIVLLGGATLGLATAVTGLAVAARSPRRLAIAGVLATFAAAVFESRSTGPPARVRDRAVSVGASVVVAGGWLSGVGREWLRPKPARPESTS